MQRGWGKLAHERGIAISGTEHWDAQCTAETGEGEEGRRSKGTLFGVIMQLVHSPDTYVLFLSGCHAFYIYNSLFRERGSKCQSITFAQCVALGLGDHFHCSAAQGTVPAPTLQDPFGETWAAHIPHGSAEHQPLPCCKPGLWVGNVICWVEGVLSVSVFTALWQGMCYCCI